VCYLLGCEVVPKFGGHVQADEIGLPVTQTKLSLPCGSSGRWER
jgi:23S rRNA (cytosine1962-C5)-methyltransferase